MSLRRMHQTRGLPVNMFPGYHRQTRYVTDGLHIPIIDQNLPNQSDCGQPYACKLTPLTSTVKYLYQVKIGLEMVDHR